MINVEAGRFTLTKPFASGRRANNDELARFAVVAFEIGNVLTRVQTPSKSVTHDLAHRVAVMSTAVSTGIDTLQQHMNRIKIDDGEDDGAADAA